MRQVLRYEVPVDDQWHVIEHAGYVIHVSSRKRGIVEFWVDTFAYDPSSSRDSGDKHEYRIFGTGHVIPDNIDPDEPEKEGTFYDYVGSTFDGSTPSLVWHLYKKVTYPGTSNEGKAQV